MLEPEGVPKIDTITDFEPGTDAIELSLLGFNTNEFKVVADDELAAVSEASITYSSGTGNLFYNQNGSDEGLGEGGQFATLQNISTLSEADFLIV